MLSDALLAKIGRFLYPAAGAIVIPAMVAAVALAPVEAEAQAVPLQAGPWAAGHVPMYGQGGYGPPLMQDSGIAAGGAAGLGLNELLLQQRGLGQPPFAGTGPFGTNFCDYDGPANGPSHYLCLGPNAGSGGILAYGASNGAPQQPFSVNLNGTAYQFPFSLSGILGPATTVMGHTALWANTVGTLFADGGPPLSWYIIDPDPTGTKDSTSALSAACKSGRPVHVPAGIYTVTDLACTLAVGQVLEGDGDGMTTIHVPSNFNKQAPGVVRIASVQPAGVVRGITFIFDQPDTTSRAGLITYPPAINTEGAPRARVERVRCQAATVCVDAKGNAGGLVVDDLQSSAFVASVDLDGSLDTVRLNNLHLYPFGLTSNQQAILGDGNTFGVRSGRMDDLEISSLLAYDIGHAIFLYTAPPSANSPGGVTFGSGSNIYLDDASALTCSGPGGGWFNVVGGYATVGRANFQAIRADGCAMTITGFQFLQTQASNTPVVQALDTTGETRLTIGDSNFNTVNNDVTAIGLVQSLSLYADLHDLTFFRTPNVAYNNPTIVALGQWRGTIHDITANDKGTGSGVLLNSITDSHYSIHDLKPVGYSIQLPPNYALATINMGPGAGLYNYVPGNAPGGYATSADPTKFASLDTSNAPQSIANQANLILRSGAGLVIVNRYDTGEVGVFACGGGGITLLGQTKATSGSFIAGTPAGGQVGVAFSQASNAYYIANASGTNITVGVATTWTRQSP